MIQISLKHLLNKKEVSGLLDELLAAMKININIYGIDGISLTGNEDIEPGEKYSVELGKEVIGWIWGPAPQAKTVAQFLSYLANKELEKKVLAEETLEKYKEINVFYEIGEKLAGNLNKYEIAILTLNEARRLIPGEDYFILFYNEDDKRFENISLGGSNTEEPFGPKKEIAENVLHNGKAELINDLGADHRFSGKSLNIVSMICAPLKTKNQNIGVIGISSTAKLNYTAQDLKILNALSFYVATTIQTAKLYDDLKETFVTTIYTLAETIEKRDPYTGGHTRRVMAYSVAIAQVLQLPQDAIERVRMAAILHDIGKIGVSDSILLKSGELTEEEFQEIKMHPIYGEEILKHIKQLHDIIPGVKFHHERYDGLGYPENLAGKEIDLTARIVAVADSFDAMTTNRSYKDALPLELALDELRINAGTQFDPLIVNAFLHGCETGIVKLWR